MLIQLLFVKYVIIQKLKLPNRLSESYNINNKHSRVLKCHVVSI